MLFNFSYGNRNDNKDCKADVVAAAAIVVVVVVFSAGNFILHFCFTQSALLQWMWRSFLTHLAALDPTITWTRKDLSTKSLIIFKYLR